MSDKPHKNKKHHLKSAPPLTLEEQAKVLAEVKERQAASKAERERVELYGRSTEKMSHRQLRGELSRTIKREYSGKPPEPQAGLNILLGTVLLSVLDNTKTVVEKYTRPNQINPIGKLGWSPR